jgi:uncharacterized protein YukE
MVINRRILRLIIILELADKYKVSATIENISHVLPERMAIMAKANVDPVELRRFARELNRVNSDLETLMGGLHSRLQSLEKTWQDQEQRKFVEEFDQTMKTLNRFLESSGRHASFLIKKATIIEEYLQQH